MVTALDDSGQPRGLTCTSLVSVTLEPPTLLVSLDSGSGTLAAIHRCGRFAVNLLHSRACGAAGLFSRLGGDRFAWVRWTAAARTRQPWLVDDAFAHAGCRVRNTAVVGDHELVLGELGEVECASETPLLYGLRRFSTWDDREEPAGLGG